MKRLILLYAAALALGAAAAPAFAADPDEAASRNYVLTVDKLHRYAAFSKAMKAQESNPAFKADMAKLGPDQEHANLAQNMARLRRSPMLMNMLHQNGLTEQDAVLLPVVAMTSAMAAGLPPKDQGSISSVSPANIAFVKAHGAEVKAAVGSGG